MNLKLKRPIVFFDLETTGLQISKDRIVEIAILKIFPNGNGITANRVVLNGMNSTKKDKAKVVISYTKY